MFIPSMMDDAFNGIDTLSDLENRFATFIQWQQKYGLHKSHFYRYSLEVLWLLTLTVSH